ncbi:MAG: DUF3299 domain-containing protein [Pseudomonadota bacterium]
MRRRTFLASTSALVLASALPARAAIEITWDDLVPPEGLGQMMDRSKAEQVDSAIGLNEFDGNAGDLELFLQDVRAMREFQPEGDEINVILHGTDIKLAGYVTPVGFDEESITEFLFVPYLGACIHVPPPAPNQIIYVKNARGLKLEQMYDPVYLTGTLSAKPVKTMVADIGYSLDGGVVTPYDDW